jgi:hypothetical protein
MGRGALRDVAGHCARLEPVGDTDVLPPPVFGHAVGPFAATYHRLDREEVDGRCSEAQKSLPQRAV